MICHIVAAMLSVFTSSNSKHCTAQVVIYKANYVDTAKSKMHISKSQFQDPPPPSRSDPRPSRGEVGDGHTFNNSANEKRHI